MRRRNTCAGIFRNRNGRVPVIGKVLRGRNVRRLLYYLYGPGLANEHADPHLVAGLSDLADLEPERHPGATRDCGRTARQPEPALAAPARPGYAEPDSHVADRPRR